uniref:Eukaryotic peptide chain release factor subunit 1 n=1 Tax=Loxodes striatus TaxID=6009 RepID=ERF1_LOXST|nr:RecName: Full=Eukaryotic peptide chain release factor subunit 1; Short=Eukaryotic release factor 1; Short=eRF1 [Loxodes striatus]BAD90946.1 eukaryotic release factor 1 [Loxodes striatus]
MDVEQEDAIKGWKIRRLIEYLEKAKGNGTSLISLIIPPKEQISLINQKLTDAHGRAQNIKSKAVQKAVQDAIISTKQKLSVIKQIPPNGLILYCGKFIGEDEKTEKQILEVLEPLRAINTTFFLCENTFYTQPLRDMLQEQDKFGFIIMDGNGSLFGTLQGNAREILHKFDVDLPKKHGRGGQSALRFARLRLEKRHNYMKKVAEVAINCFIQNDRVNVLGIVLAGAAEFKNELAANEYLDQRIRAKVVTIIDVNYGGENGFNQAIELSQVQLQNVKFIKEKNLITKLFEEVAQNSITVCYGLTDTMKALEMGAVETLVIWENLEFIWFKLKNPVTKEESTVVLSPQQATEKNHFQDEANQCELNIVERFALTEWLIDNYKNYGARLEFVTDRSQEGSQFVKGFGGICGFLRYEVNFEKMEFQEEEGYLDPDEDFL